MMIKMGVLAALMVMITVSTSQDARAEDVNGSCERLCAPYSDDIHAYVRCMSGCLAVDGKHTE